MLANTSADIDVASPSAWFDSLARIGGAKIGGRAAQAVFGGTDIQTPGIMARLFQRALRAMPQYNPQQAMMHVVMDPDALETALEAAMRHQGERLSLTQATRMRKTTAGMLQAGLIPKEAYDEIVIEIEQATDPDSEQRTQAPRAPNPGDVMDGYRFRGGDPGDRNSWDPAGADSAEPPRPQSKAEYDTLPPGTIFIAPDGTTRVKSAPGP